MTSSLKFSGRLATTVALLLSTGTFFLLTAASTSLFSTRPTGFVTDQAHVLRPETIQNLEALLTELEQKTSVELAVVTVPSLDGRDINDYASELFQKWGIGKKGKDNGVLFLIAPIDRRVRIEVGYGLEGTLNDARTGRILDEAVTPAFRAGDLEAGIVAGTQRIATEIARDAHVSLQGAPAPRATDSVPHALSTAQQLFFFFVLILIVLSVVRHPWLFFLFMGGGGNNFGGGGGGFGGGFGGFGGGSSGGGGASRGW